MEVLYRNQPVFGAQPAAMVYPSAAYPALSPHLFGASPSSSQAFTCYSFESGQPHSSSPRAPTPPEFAFSSSSSSSAPSPPNQGATLKSVLRGEVPEAYSHFLTCRSPGQGASGPCSPLDKRLAGSPFVDVDAASSSSCSPPAAVSASVLSPPPEDMQTEPMDLSFKRPTSTSSGTVSPASFHHTFPPSPGEDHHHSPGGEFSLLRNLLQVGKASCQLSPSPAHPSSSFSSSSFLSSSQSAPPSSSSSSSSFSSSSSDRSCDSPCSDSGFPTRHLCGSTRVTLAKKNMYPVSARVSDWLQKVVQFANSLQCFREELQPDDQFTLILNSWSRLLLLFMAESNFQFAVTPLRSDPQPQDGGEVGGSPLGGAPSPDEPTVKSVEAVQSFIRKCQHMGVEAEEYYYLRMLVLFNSSYVGLSQPAKVDSFNTQVQQSLQQHVQSAWPSDVMHYSRLLMCLPSLYGISAKMVERLFCRHLDRSSASDMDTLLREMLHNVAR